MELYYHEASPPAQALMMLVNCMDIKCQLKFVDLLKDEQTKEFTDINPIGHVPCLKDGDFFLAESRPVGVYLCMTHEEADKKNKLYPTEIREMAKMNMMLSLETEIYNKVYAYAGIRKMLDGEQLAEDKKEGMYWGLGIMEMYLSKNKYFAADHLTLVDFFAISTIKILDLIPFGDWDKYPQILRWKSLMEKVLGYQEGLAKHVKKYADIILSSYWGQKSVN